MGAYICAGRNSRSVELEKRRQNVMNCSISLSQYLFSFSFIFHLIM